MKAHLELAYGPESDLTMIHHTSMLSQFFHHTTSQPLFRGLADLRISPNVGHLKTAFYVGMGPCPRHQFPRGEGYLNPAVQPLLNQICFQNPLLLDLVIDLLHFDTWVPDMRLSLYYEPEGPNN